MNLPLLLGIVGMALILLAFFMGQIKRWSQDDLIYDLVNLVGSVLLVTYAIPSRSWPFIILNGTWAAVSLKDVITDLLPNGRHQPQASK